MQKEGYTGKIEMKPATPSLLLIEHVAMIPLRITLEYRNRRVTSPRITDCMLYAQVTVILLSAFVKRISTMSNNAKENSS
jgi:hypothetical protein